MCWYRRFLWNLIAMSLLVACGSLPISTPPSISTVVSAPAPVTTEEAPAENTPLPLAPNPDDTLRIEFFRKGGLWSTLLPAQSGDNQNNVLIFTGTDGLTGVSSIVVGSASYTDAQSHDAAVKVLDLLEADSETWKNFAAAFANGMQQGELTARLMATGPIPHDGKIVVSSSMDLTALEFAAAVEQIAHALGGELAGNATEKITGLPTATQQATATSAPVAPTVLPTDAATRTAAGVIVAIPQLPVIPAIPTIIIPHVPTLAPLPNIVLTPGVPAIPALPVVPQPGDSGEAVVSATSAVTLSAALDTQTQTGTATADSITLDLVLSADNTQILSSALHLKNVKCPNSTMGGLDQAYTRPVQIVDREFAIQISEQGVIKGEVVAPDRAQGVADLSLSLPIPGLPAVECDLGQWEWEATVH